MNNPNESVSMALFCDFENVALGVRDTKFHKFDIRPVLERLLLKGSIVVKKAYCDWERYKEFKAPMHEANFELIEIPHVRQSGKNSADIRLVVDALDFCYTKSHVNTFVIISGDSDFSPLVSKLRENDKKVIGVGVKQSTSDLLIANCDEFIFYDDLAREGQRAAEARRDNRGANGGQRRTPDEERRRKEEQEARRTQAVEMVVETFEALVAERGDSGKIWASALKDALKRRKPDFNESYYGFRAFGNLLEEAQSRGFLEVGREEKSGTYVYRDSAGGEPAGRPAARAQASDAAEAPSAAAAPEAAGARPARNARGGRKTSGRGAGQKPDAAPREESAPAAAEAYVQPEAPRPADAAPPAVAAQLPPIPKPAPPQRQPMAVVAPPPVVDVTEWTFVKPSPQIEEPAAEPAPAPAKRARGARKTTPKAAEVKAQATAAEPAAAAPAETEPAAKPARKTARKTAAPRRTRKAAEESS